VQAGGTLVITAMVQFDPKSQGVDPKSWTLTIQGGGACSPGCGMLSAQTSSSATYTAPAAPPASDMLLTITATSQSDPRQMGNIGIIFSAIHVSVSPSPATVAEDTTQQFTGTVTFDPRNGGVNWTLTQGTPPVACSPGCGTISAANSASGTPITYSAPATVPNPATVTLTATSVTDPRQTGTSTITVVNPDSALTGQYAFLFNVFDDATGMQVAVAGSFKADGFGNITTGVEDINGPAGPQTGIAITKGTYVIGLDNRGTLTITNSLLVNNVVTYAFSVGSFNNGVAAKGRLIEFDDNTGTTGKRGSGVMRLQDSTAFTQASITGSYAFGISGQDKGGSRLAAAGIFSADGKGSITSGLEDTNDAGTVTNSVNITGGSYSVPDANGRATGKVTTATQTTDFSLYVVSPSEALIMTTDTESIAGLQSGSVLSQVSASTPFKNSSLNAVSTFYEIGVNSASPTTQSDARIGLFTPNGTGGLSVTSVENDAGKFTPEATVNGLMYSADASGNGRVTVTGGADNPILYLLDNNKGFILGTSASIGSGFFEPQSGAPYTAFSLSGNFFFGVAPPAVTASTVSSGLGIATNFHRFLFFSVHTLHITEDSSASNGTLTTGTTSSTNFNVSANGLVTTANNSSVMYLVSPKKFVLINQSGAAPTVSIFEQ
jgi:hypothetical protein